MNGLGGREDGRSLYSHKEGEKDHGRPQANGTAVRAGVVQGHWKQGNIVIVAVRRETRPRDLRNQVGTSRDKRAAPSDRLAIKHRGSVRTPGKMGLIRGESGEWIRENITTWPEQKSAACSEGS